MGRRIILAVLLLGAAACTKDTTSEGAALADVEMRELTVESMAGTRTELADNGYAVLWTPGDRIGVFVASDAKFTSLDTPLTYQGTVPAPSGRFTGEAGLGIGASEYTLYAYYPYTEQAQPRIDSVGFVLPALQRQRASGDTQHLGRYDFAVAQVVRSATGEFEPLIFRHAFAVAEIELTASGPLAGRSLLSVSLYSSDPSTTSYYGTPEGTVQMNGPFAFDLGASENYTARWAGGEDRSLSVRLEFDEPPVLGSEAVNAYLTLNPEDYSAAGGTLYLVAETVDGYVATVALPGIAITAGQLRYVALDLVGGTAPAAEIDLTASGERANCYVVDRAGQRYSFDAATAGNGVVTPALAAAVQRYEGRVLSAALGGGNARLLWQSDRNLIEPGSVKWSAGRIFFTTSERPALLGGNAVIALYADAASDEVLWSWHIWVTDRSNEELLAAAQTYVLAPDYESVYGAGSTRMMDRTLGALTDEQSPYTRSLSAMLYQWGRKDPFPAQNVVYGDGGEKIAYIYEWIPAGCTGEPGRYEGYTGNTAYAIAHPATFIFTQRNSSSFDWYYGGGTGNGADVRNNELWGNPTGWQAGQNTTKTLFDPCPPGWKMPHAYAFSAFTKSGKAAEVASGEAYVSGSFVQGWQLRYDGTNDTFYPIVGMRNDALGIYSVSTAGFYWSSSPVADSFGGDVFYESEIRLSPESSNPRATALPVRCMKEIR